MKRLRPFLVALQFLTWLPVHLPEPPDEREIGRSLLYYPLVGLLLGLMLSALAWAIRDGSSMLDAALLLAVWVFMTGALHLDGFADSADGWIGGQGSRERTLAIMKDPYCGPAGAVALILLLLVKLAALDALAAQHQELPLVLAPLIPHCLPCSSRHLTSGQAVWARCSPASAPLADSRRGVKYGGRHTADHWHA